MKHYKILAVCLLMVPVMGSAEYLSGNTLLSRINSSDVSDRLLALGYIMGVSDAYQGKGHCAPIDVTAGQTRDIVKIYLEQNPQTRNISADLLTVVAISKAFPCKQDSKNGRGA